MKAADSYSCEGPYGLGRASASDLGRTEKCWADNREGLNSPLKRGVL